MIIAEFLFSCLRLMATDICFCVYDKLGWCLPPPEEIIYLKFLSSTLDLGWSFKATLFCFTYEYGDALIFLPITNSRPFNSSVYSTKALWFGYSWLFIKVSNCCSFWEKINGSESNLLRVSSFIPSSRSSH